MTDATQEKFAGFIVELHTIDVRLSRIDATLATKADLAKLESTLLKWFFGTTVVLTIATTVIAFTIAKLMH